MMFLLGYRRKTGVRVTPLMPMGKGKISSNKTPRFCAGKIKSILYYFQYVSTLKFTRLSMYAGKQGILKQLGILLTPSLQPSLQAQEASTGVVSLRPL